MKAWQHELEMLRNAVPADFSENPSDWSGVEKVLDSRRALLGMLWKSEVPGSRAPESVFTAAIQAWHNRGYDVSEAEELMVKAWEAHAAGRYGELEKLSGQILRALWRAPKDPSSPYWKYAQPTTWEEISAAMPAVKDGAAADRTVADGAAADGAVAGSVAARAGADAAGAGSAGRGQRRFAPVPEGAELERRIHAGWLGQIVGGAYGTALEGYTGETLRRVYGDKLNYYVKEPETYNDDITYELAFLAAADEKGKDFTSDDIADKWLELIPFGWSAEYFALENLRRGLYPPQSGSFGNFYSEWIGAQMRTMVCGLVAPGDPLRAARYAFMDSIVSHEKNGVYGGIHSAVLTSLAFVMDDAKDLLLESRRYVPDGTQFAALLDDVTESVQKHPSHLDSWARIEERLKTYNWIHTYPNMAAVVHALWYCENDFDRALRILADCGMDVDCNAGEVCCALGVMLPEAIGEKWTKPFNDLLKTYVPGYEEMRISELAKWTYGVCEKLR